MDFGQHFVDLFAWDIFLLVRRSSHYGVSQIQVLLFSLFVLFLQDRGPVHDLHQSRECFLDGWRVLGVPVLCDNGEKYPHVFISIFGFLESDHLFSEQYFLSVHNVDYVIELSYHLCSH